MNAEPLFLSQLDPVDAMRLRVAGVLVGSEPVAGPWAWPVPYSYGAGSPSACSLYGVRTSLKPSAPRGLDCSGLVQLVLVATGRLRLGEVDRSAASLDGMGWPLVESPVPGDLVFRGSPAYHVGICVAVDGLVGPLILEAGGGTSSTFADRQEARARVVPYAPGSWVRVRRPAWSLGFTPAESLAMHVARTIGSAGGQLFPCLAPFRDAAWCAKYGVPADVSALARALIEFEGGTASAASWIRGGAQ